MKADESKAKYKLGDQVVLVNEPYIPELLTVISDPMDCGGILYNLEAYDYYTDAYEVDLRPARADEIEAGYRIERPCAQCPNVGHKTCCQGAR